jgi:hypothetical protein
MRQVLDPGKCLDRKSRHLANNGSGLLSEWLWLTQRGCDCIVRPIGVLDSKVWLGCFVIQHRL